MRNFLHLIAAYGLLTAGFMGSVLADDHEMDMTDTPSEDAMMDMGDAVGDAASMAAEDAMMAAADQAGGDMTSPGATTSPAESQQSNSSVQSDNSDTEDSAAEKSSPNPCGLNGARRCALNNNILIEDHDDVFMFPQKAHSKFNANRVRLDTDGERTQGTFFSKIGKSGAWGLAVSHAQNVNSTGIGLRSTIAGKAVVDKDKNPLIEQTADAHQVLDVFYSDGGRDAWGVRFSIGSGGNVGMIDAQGEKIADTSNLNLGITGGYTIKGAITMDLGVKLHYASMNVDDSHVKKPDTEGFTVNKGGEGQVIDIEGNFRGYIKNFQPKVDLGLIGALTYSRRAHVALSSKIKDETDSQIGFKMGAGPVFRLDKSTVSTYALINFQYFTESTSEDSGYSVAIPEVNIAFETPLNDWLMFRGGIGYSFVVSNRTSGDSKRDPMGSRGDVFATEVVDTGGATSAIGLGAKWNDLTFDLALNKAWLTDGPYFLTGRNGETTVRPDDNDTRDDGVTSTAAPWAAKAAVSYNW